MHIPPQVTFRDLPHSPALEDTLLAKIDKLEQFYPNIMRCEVVVEQAQKHQHRGKLFQVKVLLSVPGKKISVTHASEEDVYIAVRDAFNAARRQLQSFARQQRGEVKQHPLRLHGRVVRLFPMQGFGFVACNGDEYYFSRANLHNGDFEHLDVGAEVAFIETIEPNGQPQAHRVTIHKDQAQH